MRPSTSVPRRALGEHSMDIRRMSAPAAVRILLVNDKLLVHLSASSPAQVTVRSALGIEVSTRGAPSVTTHRSSMRIPNSPGR